MVLAQPHLTARLVAPMVRFHPTMVLAQLDEGINAHWYINGFHPTMVLAQREYKDRPGAIQRVSIPLWFSLNQKRASHSESLAGSFHPTMVLAQPSSQGFSAIRPLPFPSHYGSRSTLFSRLLCNSPTSVSIPLWFSLNSKPPCTFFQNPQVSIPLWFSLNEGCGICGEDGLMFPSHYGSRSTILAPALEPLATIVSIPLWFSLNSLYYKNYTGLQGVKSNRS